MLNDHKILDSAVAEVVISGLGVDCELDAATVVEAEVVDVDSADVLGVASEVDPKRDVLE